MLICFLGKHLVQINIFCWKLLSRNYDNYYQTCFFIAVQWCISYKGISR